MQVLELGVAGASAQGVTVAVESSGWLVKVNSTVPVGGLLVPLAVSVTVTTQVAGLFAGVDIGQASAVDVVRAMTLIVSPPELVVWSVPGIGL